MLQRCLMAALLAAMPLSARAEIIYGLTVDGLLVTFDSATPGTLLSSTAVTGLENGESLHAIDCRPADGLLYGVSSGNVLYVLDEVTGDAQQVAILPVALSGNHFGFDFNPTIDRIRVVSDSEQNIRVIPTDGNVIVDGSLAYSGGDPNEGASPNVVASAYTNNFIGTTTTTLYGIDTATESLVIQNPPNSGAMLTVGPLGISGADGHVSMDISANSGTAYGMFPVIAGTSLLAVINLATGAATIAGDIGGDSALKSIAVKLGTYSADGEAVVGLSPNHELVKFRTNNLRQVSLVPIVGIAGGETIISIDFRPLTGQLYGLSDQDNLYTLNTATGVATLVGALSVDVTAGVQGFDFNPAADNIRLVHSNEQNLRINPVNAVAQVDLPLSYNPGDANFGADPHIAGLAYDNNFVNTGATLAYGIDVAERALVLINPANAGLMTTVGDLDLNATEAVGFDVSGRSGYAYASLSAGSHLHTSLYVIDRATGSAILLGPIGGGIRIVDISVAGFAHSADVDLNNSISLSELLRVVQFYNLLGYHCPDGASSEDGFLPGAAAPTGCVWHSSDYNVPTPDYAISLTELLRLVQMYNAGAYRFCPEDGTEDDYCVGAG